MSYTSITDGHQCNCLEEASENCQDIFARRIRGADDLKEGDFRSHFERGKQPDLESCDYVCGYRGLSMDLWNEESEIHIRSKYNLTHDIAPMMRRPKFKVGLFKCLQGAGMVKYTPNQPHGIEKYHYDLYKSDGFTVSMLELVQTIAIPD